MNDGEAVAYFLLNIGVLTNQMKSCGEKITELQKVEKVLTTLTAKFDHIVVATKESKNLYEMNLKELKASLEARELRLRHGNYEKVTKQAL